MADKSVSQLITDLESIPGIIANLGLGIAEAQKALNLTYLEGIERVVALARSLMGDQTLTDAQLRLVLLEVLKALAPTRYQYTKTTMSVKLDLAQSLRVTGQIGAGVSLHAIVVNAALALSFGHDYRGAAEVQTTIDAVPAGETEFFRTLVEQAAKQGDKDVKLPATPQTDQALIDASQRIAGQLGRKPAAIAVAAPPAPAGGG